MRSTFLTEDHVGPPAAVCHSVTQGLATFCRQPETLGVSWHLAGRGEMSEEREVLYPLFLLAFYLATLRCLVLGNEAELCVQGEEPMVCSAQSIPENC